VLKPFLSLEIIMLGAESVSHTKAGKESFLLGACIVANQAFAGDELFY
jgi:hypothetical protein